MNQGSTSTQLIIVVGGVLTTFIAYYYRDKIAKVGKKPRDRIDIIFDGYEKLLKQQQIESGHKDVVIQRLDKLVEALRAQLNEAERIIGTLKEDLVDERREAAYMRRQLKQMKTDYASGKLDRHDEQA